jgi:hypothetical protein
VPVAIEVVYQATLLSPSFLWVGDALWVATGVTVSVGVFLGTASLLVRWRTAGAPERRQLGLYAVLNVAAAVAVIVFVAFGQLPERFTDGVVFIWPIAVDRRQYRWLALAIAACSVVLLEPLRRRIRRGLERRFLGDRSDPLRALERLHQRVDQSDETAVFSGVADTVAAAVRAPHVALVTAETTRWLRSANRPPSRWSCRLCTSVNVSVSSESAAGLRARPSTLPTVSCSTSLRARLQPSYTGNVETVSLPPPDGRPSTLSPKNGSGSVEIYTTGSRHSSQERALARTPCVAASPLARPTNMTRHGWQLSSAGRRATHGEWRTTCSLSIPMPISGQT